MTERTPYGLMTASERAAFFEQLEAQAKINRGEGERTALYRLYDASDVLLYVGTSKNPVKRWATHAKTKSWWHQVARRDVTWFDSRPDAHVAEHRAIVAEHPLRNSPKDPQGLYPGVKRPAPVNLAGPPAAGR